MRIVIVVRILWPAGAPKIAIKEYHALKAQGHEVELLFLRRGDRNYSYGDMLVGVNYRVIREEGDGLLTPIFTWLTRKFASDRGKESTVDYDLIRKCPEYIRNNADLVICHDQWAGLCGYYQWKKRRTPYNVFIHERLSPYNVPLLGVIAHRLQENTLRHASRVFAVTSRVETSVLSMYPFLKGKTSTVLPGLDSLGHESTFGERKNYLLAIAMWDYGRQPNAYLDVIEAIDRYELIMAGTWRTPRLQKLFLAETEDRGLQERVKLVSGLPEDALMSLYQESKFSIRFGFGEFGLGTSVMESIQNLTPVIMNAELGTSELIRKHGGGLVLDSIDPPTISDFIQRNDDPESYELLQTQLANIKRNYSWVNHAKTIIEM